MEELIICPWCMSVTSVTDDEVEFKCTVCERYISQEDIEDAAFKKE